MVAQTRETPSLSFLVNKHKVIDLCNMNNHCINECILLENWGKHNFLVPITITVLHLLT